MTCTPFSGLPGRTALMLTVIGILLTITGGSARAQTESVLLKFNGITDGAGSQGGLVADSAGNLYGTNIVGGSGYGTVFELSPPTAGGAWTESVLHNFTNSPDGFYPTGPLVLDKAGNLYGTTLYGGGGSPETFGMVFQLSPPTPPGGAWTETILYRFLSPPDGQNPNGGLVIDAAGNLYGTTANGGACERGSVFEVSPPPTSGASWTEKIIYSFRSTCNGKTSNDGASPLAGLAMNSSGDLLGTTYGGGNPYEGTVFKLSPSAAGHSTWTEKVIYNFTGGSDGGDPVAGLLLKNGNVYGTTEYGGDSACDYGIPGCGTIFELSPPTASGGSWTETTLYAFTGGNDGANPASSLVFDKQGNLYTSGSDGANMACEYGGGQGCGSIIRLAPPAAPGGTWTETTLYDFTGRADGGTSPSALVLGLFNRLYGATYAGGNPECGAYGSAGCGVVFRIIP